MLEIFNRVFLNLMFLQKTIQLVTGGNAGKTSELVSGNALLAIGFETDIFQNFNYAASMPSYLNCKRRGLPVISKFSNIGTGLIFIHCGLVNTALIW